jgi:hypothetical protein
MMSNNRKCLLAALLLLFCTTVTGKAQDIEPRESFYTRIESEPSGAEVWSGDSLIGRTPLRVALRNAVGLVLYYPGKLSPGASRIELEEEPLPEHLGVMLLRFPRSLRIRTIPGGAAVFLGDSLAGRTPVVLPRDTAVVHIHQPGYRSIALRTSGYSDDFVILHLEAIGEGRAPEVAIRGDELRLPPADILIPAGLTLAAGVAAVMLKQYADARYDEYLATRSGMLLSEAKKYDIYAGLSLAAMQLGLGYFILRMFGK